MIESTGNGRAAKGTYAVIRAGQAPADVLEGGDLGLERRDAAELLRRGARRERAAGEEPLHLSRDVARPCVLRVPNAPAPACVLRSPLG